MSELNLITAGILMIFLGSLILIFWTITRSVETGAKLQEAKNQSETKGEEIKAGGVIMIGPLPIVFGTDKKYALIAIILAIILMMLAIVFLR